jgi:thioredoxin reductase (NADPH)
MSTEPQYDVIIVGGGAAGLSAALYSVRAMLRTLVLEKTAIGGEILKTGDIENYPGFPEGIAGPDLAALYEQQARKFGTEIKYETVKDLDVQNTVKRVIGEQQEYTCKTVIIATGGEHNKLGIPGEEEYAGKGVSYCATCDGNFFKGLDVTVVGGGDAAIDEGLYLANMTGNVTVIHRRPELRASRILQQRAFSNPKMDFIWNSTAEEIHGNGLVTSISIRNLNTHELNEIPTNGVFIYVGFHPVSGYLRGIIDLDTAGHVVTNLQMESSVPGVFAAGDIRQFSDRQLGNAVGDGIAAALAAYRYIQENQD